jgi:hypothetical protein
MDVEEGEQFAFLIFIFIQWIVRGADCHLDSAGKGKDEISQATFKLCRLAVVFTRRAVSRISGDNWILLSDHLGN